MADAVSKQGVSTYFYLFDHLPGWAVHEKCLGVSHSFELPFIYPSKYNITLHHHSYRHFCLLHHYRHYTTLVLYLFELRYFSHESSTDHL